jgi:hypothetical protein
MRKRKKIKLKDLENKLDKRISKLRVFFPIISLKEPQDRCIFINNSELDVL